MLSTFSVRVVNLVWLGSVSINNKTFSSCLYLLGLVSEVCILNDLLSFCGDLKFDIM